jgi:hypothetical protein
MPFTVEGFHDLHTDMAEVKGRESINNPGRRRIPSLLDTLSLTVLL